MKSPNYQTESRSMETLRVGFNPNFTLGMVLSNVFCGVGLGYLLLRKSELAVLLVIYFLNMLLEYLLTVGRVEMNDQFIRLTTRFEQFEMKWQEVESIKVVEINRDKIVFLGPENSKKILTIPGFKHWKGDDHAALVELFKHQIEARGVPVERKVGWDARYHCKNTRVKRDVKK